MFDAKSSDNLVGYTGAELSKKGCLEASYWGEGVIACEFILKAGDDPLGILF